MNGYIGTLWELPEPRSPRGEQGKGLPGERPELSWAPSQVGGEGWVWAPCPAPRQDCDVVLETARFQIHPKVTQILLFPLAPRSCSIGDLCVVESHDLTFLGGKGLLPAGDKSVSLASSGNEKIARRQFPCPMVCPKEHIQFLLIFNNPNN